MKRLILLPMLLFACSAVAAPPSTSSSADAARAMSDAARDGADVARAADEAARAGAEANQAAAQAARAGEEAARESADAQKLADLQAHMSDLAQRMAELSAKIGDQASASALRYLSDSKSGMLGVAVRHGKAGTTVVAVSPDSPAERAGVQVGDVITGISARSMAFHGKGSAHDLAHLRVGEPVELTVQRNGKTLHLRATPERFSSADWRATVREAQRAAREATAQVRSPEFRARIQKQIDEAMKEASRATEAAVQAGRAGAWPVVAPWWGLNLAPLNADLGHYFGTDRGALVLSRDAGRYPELQPGDVITRVNGRAVARPQDAMRAFREAPNDHPVAVTVRRHDKTLKLAFKSPPRWLALPPPPPPPAPAVPPTPAAPKAPAAPPPPAIPAPPPAPPTSAPEAR